MCFSYLRGIRDVKALNAETTALHKMSERIDRTSYGKYKGLVVRWRHWFVANSCETLFGLLFFVLAIVLLRHNLVTIPIVVVVFNYRNDIISLITFLIWIVDYG